MNESGIMKQTVNVKKHLKLSTSILMHRLVYFSEEGRLVVR